MRATRAAVRDLRTRLGVSGLVALFVVVALGSAAFAYWTTTGSGTATASATNLNAPTGVTGTAVNSTVTVAFTGVTAPGGAVTGYYVTRNNGTTTSNACGTVPGTTGTYLASGATGCTDTSVPNATYTYRVTAVYRTWTAQSAASPSVVVNGDTTPPTQVVTLTSGAGTSYLTGGTIYYRGNLGGNFTLTDTVSDSGSGPASANFPALATTGWTHGNQTVTPGSGANPTKTYTSSTYTWTSGPGTPPATTITGRDVNNNAVTTNLAFASDVTAPAGGALVAGGVTATAGGASGGNLTGSYALARTDYSTDTGGSGVLNSVLVRDVAPYNNGTCGVYSGATILTGAPSESGLASGCYRYTLTGTDRVTNAASLTAIVRVDRTAPTQAFTSTGANAYATGTTLYYNSNVGGSVVLRDAVNDAESGPQKVDFPAVAANGWTHSGETISAGTGSAPTITYPSSAYTWIAGATSPAAGLRTTTAYDVAGNTSAQAVTFTADATAPAAGALSANGTTAGAGGTSSYDKTGSFSLTRTDYTDTGSGLSSSTLTREIGTLSNGTCGGYGSQTTLTGTPTQSGLATGCYRYTLTGTDNVGNTAVVSTVVMVDLTAPTQTITENGTNSYLAGNTLWYRGGAAGTMTLTDSVNDTASGPKQALFPAFTTGGWGHTGSETVTSGTGAAPTTAYTSSTITWTGAATTPPNYTITGSDQATNTTATTLTFANDSTVPTGGGFVANGTAATPGTGSSSVSNTGTYAGTYTDWTDGGSGLASEIATRETGTLSGGSCSGFGSQVTVTWTVETSLPTGCYRYTFTGKDNVGNESTVVTTVVVDRTAPTQTVTATGANVSQTGSTVYYNNTLAGSLTLSAAVADGDLGPASATFPVITTAGWNHAAETVSTPSSGTGSPLTYTSTTYTWNAGSSTPPTHNVVGADQAGNTVTTPVSFVPDVTGPTGGSLVVSGATGTAGGAFDQASRFAGWTGTWTNFGADAGSGYDTTVLTREVATGNTCTNYGPAVPLTGGTITETGTLANGCYRYTLTGTDKVGNVSVLTVTVITFTDGTDPSQAFSATGNAYYDGTRLYYRTGQPGSFDLTSTVTDTQSGPARVNFANVTATGWSHAADNVTVGVGTHPTVAYTSTYVITSATPGAPNNASRRITAYDNDGNNDQVTLTFTADNTAPTGGALTVNGTAASAGAGSTSTAVASYGGARTDYTADTGSGVASSVLTREYAPFSSGTTCGTYGTPSTVVGTPSESNPATGCYRYTLTGADRVDNEDSVTTTVKVVPGSLSQVVTMTPVTGQAVLDGTTVWYRSGAAGSFKLNDVVTGTGLAPAAASFPGVTGWGHTTTQNGAASGSAPTITYTPATNYSWTNTTTSTVSTTITGSNTGGNTVSTTMTFQPDVTGPTGATLTVNGVSGTAGGATAYAGIAGTVTGSFTDFTGDVGSGYTPGSYTLQRAYTATLNNGVCGTFGGNTTIATVTTGGTPAAGCYRFTLTGTDGFGNTSAISVIVQVDLSAPTTVGLTTPAGQNAYLNGATLYYRASGGSVVINAAVTDSQTSPASATFPAGWSHGSAETITSGTGTAPTITYPSTAYTWSSGDSAPSTPFTVVGKDLAGNSTSTSISSFVADSVGPTGGALTVNGTAASAAGTVSTATSTAFTIGSRTDFGTDGGSGYASTTVTREAAPWSGTACGTYGAAVTVSGTTQPTPAPAGGYCYRYTMTGLDRVGNPSSISTVVQVPLSPVAVQLVNGSYTSGTLNRTDQIVVTFNGPLDVSSVCSSWSGDTTDQSVTGNNVVGVTIRDGGGTTNDYMTVTTSAAACGGAFNFGTLTLGDDGYLVSTTIQTFRGTGTNQSTVAYDASSYTLTVTLGTNETTPGNDGSNAVTANTVANYVADSGIRGTGGVPITTAAVSTATTRQF